MGGNCTDIDECISREACKYGRCVNQDGTYDCVCPDGYELISSGNACIGKKLVCSPQSSYIIAATTMLPSLVLLIIMFMIVTTLTDLCLYLHQYYFYDIIIIVFIVYTIVVLLLLIIILLFYYDCYYLNLSFYHFIILSIKHINGKYSIYCYTLPVVVTQKLLLLDI